MIEASNLVDDHWVQFHSDSTLGDAFDLAAIGPIAARLNGPGLIWRGSNLLDDPAIMPVYVKPQLDKFPHHLIEVPGRLPIQRDTRPALVFHGWGIGVYGHLLIEMLPKLLLALRNPALFAHLHPVLDRAMPDWFLQILSAHAGIDTDTAIWFDSRNEQLDLTQAVILPLPLRAGGFHPACGADFTALASRIGIPPVRPSPRIFVARGAFSNPSAPKRRLENEAELAHIAESEFAFLIISPQTMTFVEQISLFSQARIILGPAGSGMHNALFAPAGTINGVIRFMAPDQSYIAALRRQRIAYLTQPIAEIEPNVFVVDPDGFRRFIAKLCESTMAGDAIGQSQ